MNAPYCHTLAPRTGWAGEIREGQELKITQVDGGISDIVVFELSNLRNRFDQGRTKANQGRFKITAGHVLYSKLNTRLMSIVADTAAGRHDLDYGMCNAWVFNSGEYKGFHTLQKYGGLTRPSRGCWEILTESLVPWGIPAEDIPSPFNAFQDDYYNYETGEIGMQESRNAPGDHIVLRAETDVLFGMTSCPCASKTNKLEILDSSEAEFTGRYHTVPARDAEPARQ